MFRLTFALAVAIYAGFVIWGQPVDTVDADARSRVIAASAVDHDRPVILTSASSTGAEVTRTDISASMPDPAAIAASAPTPATVRDIRVIGEPVTVSLLSPDVPVRGSTAEPDAEPVLLRVTGSVVNMRAGPSTADAVIDSLPRGSVTEAVGGPIGGWQEVRDVVSGRTGWMSARFLEPS